MVPLMVRSGYSLLRGTCLPGTLVELAAGAGYGAVALTDVNSLCGAPGFWKAAAARGVTGLIGAELAQAELRAAALVTSEAGYQGLCRVISGVQAGGRLLPELVAEHAAGLELIAVNLETARALRGAGVPGKQLHLALDTVIDTPAERQTEFPLVATGYAMMGTKEEAELARLQAAIRTGSTYDSVARGELPPAWAYLRSKAEYARRFAGFPSALAANERLAEAAGSFKLLPRVPVFPAYECPRGLQTVQFLRQLCEEGLRTRYGRDLPAGARRRLEHEFNLIVNLGFVEYFLVVWDIVQYARRRRAPVAGRGSGASSLVAYLLEITNVCPLKYGIPFERFLHEEREDFPDLDVDFCWRIRDEVLDYAFRRWGRDHVAMVSMHTMYQERLALRETLKAFGFANDRITQLQPEQLATDKRLRAVTPLAKRLVGLPHNLSVHPGGIVIGRMPIDRYVPVQPAPKGVNITQFDKDGVEDIRLVKIDILGNRNLSTVRYAVDLIEEHRRQTVNIERLPVDDPATIRRIQAGDTVGCNQLESPAMRHLLKMLRPQHTHDVMKTLALIRPGAASIGMKETFVRRHRGLDTAPAGHPRVDAILAGAHGVMVYEDDVMLVAAALMNTSLVEADHFRRAIQKCHDDTTRLELSREFLERCRENGVDLDYAKDLWVQMAKFNSYSFCRAHAASYGVLSYAGAWLKTHYPLEFWCASLNNNQSMYHPRVYVEAAKRMGVRFLLPEINRSGREFSLDGEAIRIGLGCVKGLGDGGLGTILKARGAGRFRGVSDFVGRTRLPEEETRSLILCGAFDGLGVNRPALLLELGLCQRGKLAASTGELFDMGPELPMAPKDYAWQRKYMDEWRVLGISAKEPLMGLHRPLLAQVTNGDSRDLPKRVGRRLILAGMLETRQGAETKQGEPMLFATFTDEYGLFEVNIYPDLARRLSDRMGFYGPYLVTGTVGEQYGSLSVDAEWIEVYRPLAHQEAVGQ